MTRQRPPSAWMEMNELDRECVDALEGVTFGIGTTAKRFAADMIRAKGDGRRITGRMRGALYAIVYRHRRQIDVRLVAKVALRLADARAAAELDRDPPVLVERRAANPLNDLFPTPAPAS